MKRALIDRGWIESTSKNAKANLKFEYKANDTGNQHQGTMLNHNSGEVFLTHKAGLCFTLNDCQIFSTSWLDGKIDIRDYSKHKLEAYYPRCYLLTSAKDHLPFFEDYVMQECEGYIKKFIKSFENDQSNNNKFIKEKIIVSCALVQRKIKLKDYDNCLEDEN